MYPEDKQASVHARVTCGVCDVVYVCVVCLCVSMVGVDVNVFRRVHPCGLACVSELVRVWPCVCLWACACVRVCVRAGWVYNNLQLRDYHKSQHTFEQQQSNRPTNAAKTGV